MGRQKPFAIVLFFDGQFDNLTLAAAQIYQNGAGPANVEKLPNMGLITTYAADLR